METKICSKCKAEKPLSEFHKDKRARDGLYSHCKACHYKLTHAYEQTEKGKEVVRNYLEKTQDRHQEYHRKHDATPERRAQRAEYAKSEAGKAASKRKYEKRKARKGFMLKAKTAVHNAIRAGNLPPIDTQVCVQCGQPAQEYHHESYDQENWLRVIPLCKKCHAITYTNPH